MVVEAPPTKPNPNGPNRPSPVSNITKISSLKRYPDRDYALDLLHQIAKSVGPIIHQYKFKVGLLCEMYPKSDALLGLNVNKGQKILIRLRKPYNSREFYPMSDLIGTFLHELTHNIHGPHDAKFYALWDELREKYESGSIGLSSNYVCEENRLGAGFTAPWSTPKTIREKRLEALSKGKYKAESRRLGGAKPSGENLRSTLLKAANRRLKDSKWCPLADLEKLNLDDIEHPDTIEKFKEVIDLTKEQNEDDSEEIEIIEVDACEADSTSPNKVKDSQLWASVLRPPLEEASFEVKPPINNRPEIQYRRSNSPGKTFISQGDIYPRRKLVADMDFDEIIKKGELIQQATQEPSHPKTIEKRTKKLPHPEEFLEPKRRVRFLDSGHDPTLDEGTGPTKDNNPTTVITGHGQSNVALEEEKKPGKGKTVRSITTALSKKKESHAKRKIPKKHTEVQSDIRSKKKVRSITFDEILGK